MAAQGSEAAAPVAEAPKEEELCVACSEAPRTVLLTACGHRSLCGPCFSRMANMPFNPDRPAACPLCRTPIVGAGFKRTREGESLPSFEAAAVEPAQVARVERFVRTGASNKGRLGCINSAHISIARAHAACPQPRCAQEGSPSTPCGTEESSCTESR